MPLTYFPVTATLKAAVSDTSKDPTGDPDIQNISSFVYFTPSTTQARSSTDHTIYRLGKLKARTNPNDGVLKNIDGTTVTLVANTPDLDIQELTYKVEFSNVVYGETNQEIDAFRFVAPTDDSPVDLTTVEHLDI